MPPSDFDVIVAGAGPAGALAAHDLVRAGMSVLVVEKAQLPRDKPCGGAIPRAGLDALPFSATSMIRAAPASVRFTFPGQRDTTVALRGEPVAMVKRSEFDAFLLGKSGAEVLEGQAVSKVVERLDSVVVVAGERTWTCRHLVAADGAASRVARDLGLRPDRQLGGSLEAEVPLARNPDLRARYGSEAVFALGAVAWGYAWVFPKGDVLSVGIGRFRRGKSDLLAALHRVMAGLGIHLDGVEITGHAIPCYQPSRPWPFWHRLPQEPIATQRCLLVGDAAGLVDPLVGEGIRHAFASARLGAQAIIRDDLSGYERTIWDEIGHSLWTAMMAARIFYNAPKLAYRVGVRNPATVQVFVDQFAGRRSYLGIGRRLMALAARWLVVDRWRIARGEAPGPRGTVVDRR